MVDAGKHFSGDSYFSGVLATSSTDSPVQAFKAERSSNSMVGVFHQDPPKPGRARLGDFT